MIVGRRAPVLRVAVSSSLAPLLRNTSPGSPPPLTAPTQAQPRRLLCISSQMLDLLPSCAYSCPPKLTPPRVAGVVRSGSWVCWPVLLYQEELKITEHAGQLRSSQKSFKKIFLQQKK